MPGVPLEDVPEVLLDEPACGQLPGVVAVGVARAVAAGVVVVAELCVVAACVTPAAPPPMPTIRTRAPISFSIM